MRLEELIKELELTVITQPELSGRLHSVVTRAFQRSVPMVGKLERKMKIRYTDPKFGWVHTDEAFVGRGQIGCGGTTRCVYQNIIYNVDHTGLYEIGRHGEKGWEIL